MNFLFSLLFSTRLPAPSPHRLIPLLAMVTAITFAPLAAASPIIRILWEGTDEPFVSAETAMPDTIAGQLILDGTYFSGGIIYWDCRIDLFGAGDFVSWDLAGGGVNAATAPNFAVDVPMPLDPQGTTVVLATFRVSVLDTNLVTFLANVRPESGLSYMHYRTSTDPTYNHGIGVWPWRQIAWVNPGQTTVSLSSYSINFGILPAGYIDETRLYVVNTGQGLLISSPELADGGNAFSLDDNSYVHYLPPGYNTFQDVVFRPLAIGEFTDTVILNDAISVPVRGASREPVLSWDLPDSLDFGALPLGPPVLQSVRLDNTGESPFTVTPSGLEFPFRVTSPAAPFTLYPERSLYLTIEFQRSQVGRFDDALDLGSILPDLPILGEARIPLVQFSTIPDPVDFPPTTLDIIGYLWVTIRNTGDFPFRIDPLIPDPSAPFVIQQGAGQFDLDLGDEHLLLVEFHPPDLGVYTGELSLGDDLGDVVLTAECVTELLACDIDPPNLRFDDVIPGLPRTQVVTVTNSGGWDLELTPRSFSDAFQVPLAPVTLGRGESFELPVTFFPLERGFFEGAITLCDEGCGPIECSGLTDLDIDPTQNRIGFFFDPELTTFEASIDQSPQLLTCYLALFNPSHPAGIAGWECRVEVSAGAELVSWDLEGNDVNAGSGEDFVVGIGVEPLPFAPVILLGTFQIAVLDTDAELITLDLGPTTYPSIHGLMAWLPWGDLENVMPILTNSGGSSVAWILRQPSVGVEMPPPSARQSGNKVVLNWNIGDAAVDGCKLYRRSEAETSRCINEGLLEASGGEIAYEDLLWGYASGTTLYYSYALVYEGKEGMRSGETEIVLAELPALETRLLSTTPNPFNPQTEILFELATATHVKVTIHDIKGHLIAVIEDSSLPPGPHALTWRGLDDAGRSLPSGVYHVRLQTASRVDTRKIMLLK
ncbi:MAG: FlgD immunoglobulin-like domain containing protein [bacterium]